MIKQVSKKVISILAIFVTVLVGAATLSAQNRTINGTVKDGAGAPVIGAAVLLVGNNTVGTVTDVDGTFRLNVPANSSVEISCMGYATQIVAVGNQSTINVILSVDTEFLEETVVVGYGVQKKATLTGSVVNVSGSEVAKSPAANVTSSLAGKLPGLIVNQRSGQPGADDPAISIRGASSFASGTNPLIIIDGVERDDMGRLNPDDIESFSVLKDASAAIYGARAANGVILITTKKGQKGKPVFSFSQNVAVSGLTVRPEMLSSADFAIAMNEGAWYRAGRPTSNYVPQYSDEIIQKFRDGNDVRYPNTDWLGELYKNSVQTRTSMSLSGGSDNVRYMLSYAFQHQGSNYNNVPFKYDQHNVRLNITADVNKYLTLGANVSTIIGNQMSAPMATGVIFTNLLTANPTTVARYPNGLLGGGRMSQNPLLLDQWGYEKNVRTPVYSTFTATLKIPYVEGLKIDASFNYDLNNSFNKWFKHPYYYYEYNPNTQEYERIQGTGATTIEVRDTYSRSTNMMYNVRLAYDKVIKKHTINAMIGVEQQKYNSSNANAYRKNYLTTLLPEINIGSTSANDKDNGGSSSISARDTYFGRFNYNYAERYLAELIFRYDGSANFAEGKRFGFFPAASFGWRISEEPWMKEAVPQLDQLKLRASLGQTGNDRVSAFQYLQTYSFGGNYVFGTTDASGVNMGGMPNPDITWERSTKYDLGLDASMWEGKLGMEFTLFKEHRTHILTRRNRSVPNTLGFTSLPDENIGETQNQGFELMLSHRNTINSDFGYNISANVTYAKSEILFMDEVPNSEEYQNRTGRPIGAQLIYLTDGIFRTQEELDAYPHHNSSQVGDLRIIDKNGDGKIDSNDQVRFDYTSTPRTVFGLNAGLFYKNFDLSLSFYGQTGAYNYDGSFASLGGSGADNAFYARFKDRWTVDNPNGTMPRSDTYTPGNTDFFMMDATFIRLKNAEIGYNLPEKAAKKIGMSGLRLYVNGSNLLTWAKEIKYCDPELSGGSTYYPQQRVINFGVNVKF